MSSNCQDGVGLSHFSDSIELFLGLDRAIWRAYLFLGGEFVRDAELERAISRTRVSYLSGFLFLGGELVRDAELVELFGIDGRRGFCHEIGGFIRLWEGDDVA